MSELWYRKPAVDWNEALPLGNGRFTQEFQKSPKRLLLRTGAEAKVVFIIRSDKLNIREFIRIMTNIPIHIRGNLIFRLSRIISIHPGLEREINRGFLLSL